MAHCEGSRRPVSQALSREAKPPEAQQPLHSSSGIRCKVSKKKTLNQNLQKPEPQVRFWFTLSFLHLLAVLKRASCSHSLYIFFQKRPGYQFGDGVPTEAIVVIG